MLLSKVSAYLHESGFLSAIKGCDYFKFASAFSHETNSLRQSGETGGRLKFASAKLGLESLIDKYLWLIYVCK